VTENLKPFSPTTAPQDDAEPEFSEAARKLIAYAVTFGNTESGRSVLEDMKASLDDATYRPGMDLHESTWRAGRRSVYLDLLSSMESGFQLLARNEKDVADVGVMPDSLEDL
jgi:hypothetical protein